jgi:hypothetical protein
MGAHVRWSLFYGDLEKITNFRENAGRRLFTNDEARAVLFASEHSAVIVT